MTSKALVLGGLLLAATSVFAGGVASGQEAEADPPAPVEADTRTPAERRRDELKVELEIRTTQRALAASRVPSLPASGVAGTIEAGSGAGQAETLILAVRQLGASAKSIVEKVDKISGTRARRWPERVAAPTSTGTAPTPLQEVFVVEGLTFPDIGGLLTYESRRIALLRQLGAAAKAAEDLPEETLNVADGGDTFSGLVGLASSILSYFKSDFELSGAAVSGPDTTMLATAVLAAADNRFGLLIEGPVSIEAMAELQAGLDGLDLARGDIEPARLQCARSRARYDAQLAAAKDPDKPAVRETFSDINARCVVIDAGVTATTAFGADYGGATGAGEKFATVVRQMEIQHRLDGATKVLLVQHGQSHGGAYTQTNLISHLGAMPFHVTTTTIVSWRLFGADGRFLGAGVESAYAGYQPLSDVDREINGCQSVDNRRRIRRLGNNVCDHAPVRP